MPLGLGFFRSLAALGLASLLGMLAGLVRLAFFGGLAVTLGFTLLCSLAQAWLLLQPCRARACLAPRLSCWAAIRSCKI
jgi:hypothetical protein